MTETSAAGEVGQVGGGSGGRTVVVGVKLDSQSRELLTWALVKVAQSGDRVIALHVLSDNEVVDRDGNSLLSLIKAFESVLAVYEGFCNLKQVDLKLKICKGSSTKRILVREAKSYHATDVIVGTARSHHKIRSWSSVAKCCAKKLAKDCSILAVNNGKVVYQREASPKRISDAKGTEDDHRNGLISTIQRSLSKTSRVVNVGNADVKPTDSHDHVTCGRLNLALMKAGSGYLESTLKKKCSICSSVPLLPDYPCTQSLEESSGNGDEDTSRAVVPVLMLEAASSSTSLLIREVPELRPGWPLIRRAIFSKKKSSDRCSSVQKISVARWAMRLPRKYLLQPTRREQKHSTCDSDGDRSSELDGESGVNVPVGSESKSAVPPDHVSRSLPKEVEDLYAKCLGTCRLFKLEELKSATSNFMPENFIGKGGSSQVYRGCLPDGQELAVKILKPSEDVLKEFVLEIEIVTTLHHKNIITPLGFCYEDNNLLLVYNFLSRGSLEENLHGYKKDTLAFGWSERYKVAIGVAEALDYLHNKSAKSVIHGDVKSSNILLSDEFEPKLSDFGLAKWAPTSSSYITCTDVAGTFGYLAPEYFMYGKVNDKIDVYAFGVVLLELLSGRKPINSDNPKGQESLVMWATPILNGGKFAQLLDPSLGSDYDISQTERMVLAATLCIRRAPRARPKMSHVLKLLQDDTEVTNWARLQVNDLEVSDMMNDEAFPKPVLQSHLNVALLDVDEDSLSMSSIEQNVSLEDYLQGRWSRSSSFD